MTLRDSSGATRLVLLQGTLATTPASVSAVAAPDRSNLGKIAMSKVIIPATGGIRGMILLAAGLLPSRRLALDLRNIQKTGNLPRIRTSGAI